jgi:hypothetical protein
VSNSCGIYEDIKRFLTGNVQKLKFFHRAPVAASAFAAVAPAENPHGVDGPVG